MGRQRGRAEIHSKRADSRGRSKNRRHGTRDFTSWVAEREIAWTRFYRKGHKGRSQPGG